MNVAVLVVVLAAVVVTVVLAFAGVVAAVWCQRGDAASARRGVERAGVVEVEPEAAQPGEAPAPAASGLRRWWA